jgi:hypothetical protein
LIDNDGVDTSPFASLDLRLTYQNAKYIHYISIYKEFIHYYIMLTAPLDISASPTFYNPTIGTVTVMVFELATIPNASAARQT